MLKGDFEKDEIGRRERVEVEIDWGRLRRVLVDLRAVLSGTAILSNQL